MSLYIERRKVSCFVQKYLATDRFMKIAAQPKKRVSLMFDCCCRSNVTNVKHRSAAEEGRSLATSQGQTRLSSHPYTINSNFS